MYLSGTLKDKAINFYKDSILSYDYQGIIISNGSFSYDGELLFAPWEKDIESKLISRERKHFDKKVEDILALFNSNFYRSEIKKVIDRINNSPRKYSYLAIEGLYYNLRCSRDIIGTLREYNTLLDYLEDTYENQSSRDLDAIIDLYSLNKRYDSEDELYRYKKRKYIIDESKIDTTRILELYYLGEFLSPKRLSKIGMTINDPMSDKVLPIYFSIKDEYTADRFINICKSDELDTDMVIRNAEKLGVNDNIINLIKK